MQQSNRQDSSPSPSEGARERAQRIVNESRRNNLTVEEIEAELEAYTQSLSQSTAPVCKRCNGTKIERDVVAEGGSWPCPDCQGTATMTKQKAEEYIAKSADVEVWFDQENAYLCDLRKIDSTHADERIIRLWNFTVSLLMRQPNVEPPYAPRELGPITSELDLAKYVQDQHTGPADAIREMRRWYSQPNFLASFEKQNSSSQASTQPEGGRE